MKKVGILTYHSVCNFGANLQALSTVGYFKKNGMDPIVIDWVPENMEQQYRKTVPPPQFSEHEKFVNEYLPITQRCRSEDEIMVQIKSHAVDGVVIGSDAVVQHKSLWSRLHFPTRRLYSIAPPPPEQLLFPNPFWGCFAGKAAGELPVAMMSVSSQNEKYFGIQGAVKAQMYDALDGLSYISVRDDWTRKMFKHISSGRIVPPVTPDPVFSFNQNTGDVIAGKESLFEKFYLAKDYILLSFVKKSSVDGAWIADFAKIAARQGIECLMLPMPRGHIYEGIEGVRYLPLPLSPLDWYGLIKNAFAYVGHNMHPMIVAMHNKVPFYSFDYYGILNLKCFVNASSSKIYDILKKAGMLKQRSRDVGLHCPAPEPEVVFRSIAGMADGNGDQGGFSEKILSEYNGMMHDLVTALGVGGGASMKAKRVAVFAYNHGESTLPLVKHLAAKGYVIDYFFVTPYRASGSAAFNFGRKLCIPGLHKGSRELMDSLYDYMNSENVSIYFVVLPPFGQRYLYCIARLIFVSVGLFIRYRKYNIINIVGQNPPLLDLYSSLGRVENVFASLHEVSSHYDSQFISNSIVQYLVTNNINIITHSLCSYHKVLQVDNVKKEKVFNIPFGTFETYGLFSGCSLELPDEPYILFYGIIRPYKGLDVLYDAVQRMGDQLGQVRVVVAGYGSDAMIDKMKGDPRYVVMNRYVSNEEIVSLNAGALCVVCPYKSASQSGVVTTAFYFGTPVVASDVGGFSEYIDDQKNGLLVPADNAEALAAGLYRLISDLSFRETLARGARDFSSSPVYSWQGISRRYEAVFGEAEVSDTSALRAP